MSIAITAIGTANPIHKENQTAIATFIAEALNLQPKQKRLLHSVYRSAGIQQRYSVLGNTDNFKELTPFFSSNTNQSFLSTAERMKIYERNALTLALNAIQHCWSQLDEFNKSSITHLITVSCTGMYAPGLDIEITHTLKLNSNIKRTCINFMGCYGVFNALKIAHTICQADSHAKVLIVSVELCSLHLQKKMDLESIISNAIFADGAAAALIETNPTHIKYFSLETFHCDLLPETEKQMAWRIGDFGFDIVLSSYVPATIEHGIKKFANRLLEKLPLDLQDIDYFAIHPGGAKILRACEKAMGLPKHKNRYAYHVLANYGNMSSATILFVLKEIWNDIKKEDHNKTMFSCAFGPGLTLESMLLKTHYA